MSKMRPTTPPNFPPMPPVSKVLMGVGDPVMDSEAGMGKIESFSIPNALPVVNGKPCTWVVYSNGSRLAVFDPFNQAPAQYRD